MIDINQLLSKLSRVKKLSGDRWKACCPAHEDKSPSLVISLKDDRILIHCFSGCSALSVVEAMGFTLADLMPDDKEILYEKVKFRNEERVKYLKSDEALEMLHLTVNMSSILFKKLLTTGTLNKEEWDSLRKMYIKMNDVINFSERGKY